MRRISMFFAGALVAGAFVVACGGGGKTVTKAEFITAADKVCEASQAEMDKLPDPTSEAELNDLVHEAIKIERKQLEDLRALDTPKADEKALKSLFDSVEAATSRIEDDPSLLTNASEDPFAASSKAASEYGFKVCGAN